MFEEGKPTRLSVGDKSEVATPRGIATGASAAPVRKAYPNALPRNRTITSTCRANT